MACFTVSILEKGEFSIQLSIWQFVLFFVNCLLPNKKQKKSASTHGFCVVLIIVFYEYFTFQRSTKIFFVGIQLVCLLNCC